MSKTKKCPSTNVSKFEKMSINALMEFNLQPASGPVVDQVQYFARLNQALDMKIWI